MKIEADKITFSSGRTAYANCGIVGLSPGLELSQGYDGGFYYIGSAHEDDLHKGDMAELADHMIEQWKLFKSSLDEKPIVEAADNGQ